MTRCIILLTLAAAALPAQTPAASERYNGNSYAYATLGGCQHGYFLAGAGGGGEAFLWKGVSLGADASYQTFNDGLHFGLAQVQGGYHFINRRRSAKWDPFVTAGFGVGFRDGVASAGNLGGGFTYWFRDKIGLRFEGRAQGVGGEVIVAARIGISFR
ncbi:MAG: hypothetical protein SFV54_25230 [Bryobacteraceae bacterium]|nr:hypothetical protein [Bryobacteraceae bacterium]